MFGKILFIVCDVLSGVLIYKILRLRGLDCKVGLSELTLFQSREVKILFYTFKEKSMILFVFLLSLQLRFAPCGSSTLYP